MYERKCHLCGRNGMRDPLETHHVFRGKNRALSEAFHATVLLCGNSCHRNGKNSVHKNPTVNLQLEQEFQKKIMEEYEMDMKDWIFVFGRNYLDMEEDAYVE